MWGVVLPSADGRRLWFSGDRTAPGVWGYSWSGDVTGASLYLTREAAETVARWVGSGAAVAQARG